jgi:uncharacterized protein (DUF1919 family)
MVLGAREMWAIVSNNCWGADLYQEAGLEYNTPTVGLWIHADDYIALLSDFRTLMASPLRFTQQSRHGPKPHPVGVLGDGVEVQFQHYESEDEALRKWTARAARLPASDDDLYIKVCDRDGFDQGRLDAFARLPFAHKVGFFKRGRFDVSGLPWAIEVESSYPTVDDGLRLWRQVRDEGIFDAGAWVRGERV